MGNAAATDHSRSLQRSIRSARFKEAKRRRSGQGVRRICQSRKKQLKSRISIVSEAHVGWSSARQLPPSARFFICSQRKLGPQTVYCVENSKWNWSWRLSPRTRCVWQVVFLLVWSNSRCGQIWARSETWSESQDLNQSGRHFSTGSLHRWSIWVQHYEQKEHQLSLCRFLWQECVFPRNSQYSEQSWKRWSPLSVRSAERENERLMPRCDSVKPTDWALILSSTTTASVECTVPSNRHNS